MVTRINSESAKASEPSDNDTTIGVESLKRHDEPTVLVMNSGKGGAGKTALAHAIVHTVRSSGLKPVIFDFDAANPDLWAGWTEVDENDRFALQTRSFDGWESVMKMIQSLDASNVVVVDLPANAGELVEPFLGPMMEIGGYHATLWALDPGRKPMDALLKYAAVKTAEPIVVAKSIFKADNGDRDFEAWGRFGAGVDLRGGFVFDVPPLDSAVRIAMVEGGEAAMTIEDLGTDRGGWSISKIAEDKARPLHADRAKKWLAKLKPNVERAIAVARRVAP